MPPRPPLRSNRERWWSVAALVLIAAVYLGTASRVDMDVANNDISSAAFGAWRIAESGQPWLDDASGVRYEPVPDRSWVATNPGNGREVMSRSPGVVAAVVPMTWVFSTLGDETFGPGPQLLTAALLTTSAVALLFSALRHRLDLTSSAAATLGVALATPVWSVSANGIWPHTLTVLGIFGMAWGVSTERWWLVGAFGGIALWGRLHAALIVAVLGVGLALLRRRPTIAVKIGVVSAAAMGLASVWSWWHYSSWVPSGGYGGSAATRVAGGAAEAGLTEGVLPNQLGMWVSPAYGVLVWTPVLLVLLPGLVRRRGQVPDWAWLLLGAGVLYTLVQAQLNIFTGGAGFYGYRHCLELLACATPAFAFSVPGMGVRTRRVTVFVVSFQFAVIAMGAVFDGGFISPERAWRTNALVEIVAKAPATALLGLLLMAAALLAAALTSQQVSRTRSDRDASVPSM